MSGALSGRIAPTKRRQRREQEVADRVEVEGRDARQDDALHPEILSVSVRALVRPAIDDNLDAFGRQPAADLLDSRLRPAVARRHSPNSSLRDTNHSIA